MPAPAHPLKKEAIQALVARFRETGQTHDLRARYCEIPKSTWTRWVGEAKARTVQSSVADVLVRGASPRRPSSELEVLATLSPLAHLNQFQRVFESANQLERFALDRQGEVRMPKVLASSATLRLQAVRAQMEVFRTIWDVERIRVLFDTVVEVIRDVSPELAQQVIDRLQEAERRPP